MGVAGNLTGGSNSSDIAMSPLVEMQATAPHTLTIRITPRPLLPGMGIRVSYERVPHHYPARHQQASSMAGLIFRFYVRLLPGCYTLVTRLDMLDSPVRLMLYPAVSPVIQKLENLPRGKAVTVHIISRL